MPTLPRQNKTRWVLIALAVAVVSLIGGFLYGMATAPTGVRAQAGAPASAPTPTPQATTPTPSPGASPTPLPAGAPTPQATPTQLPDSYALPSDLPPLTPVFPTPTAEDEAAADEAMKNCPTGNIGKTPKPLGDGVWKCLGGRYGLPLSEEEIKEEWAKRRSREAEEAKLRAIAQSQKIEYLEFEGRSRSVKVPDDVRVQRLFRSYQCTEGWYCPQPPQYELTRKQTTIWVDRYGYLFYSEGDMSDPNLFSFLDGVVEDVRRKR